MQTQFHSRGIKKELFACHSKIKQPVAKAVHRLGVPIINVPCADRYSRLWEPARKLGLTPAYFDLPPAGWRKYILLVTLVLSSGPICILETGLVKVNLV